MKMKNIKNDYWTDFKDIIFTKWDISFEELLETKGDLNALILLVCSKNGKSYNETRDELNLIISNKNK